MRFRVTNEIEGKKNHIPGEKRRQRKRMYYIGMHDADYVSIYIEKMHSVGDDFAAAYFRLWNITSKMLLNRIPVVQFIETKKERMNRTATTTTTITASSSSSSSVYKNRKKYIANRRQLSAEKNADINKYNKMYKNEGISPKWDWAKIKKLRRMRHGRWNE